MLIHSIARSFAPVCVLAMLAGCGQVDSMLVMDEGGLSGAKNPQISYADAKARQANGGAAGRLSKEDDPIVFLESAAMFAERQREYDTAAKHWAHLASLEPKNMNYVRNLALSLRVLGRHEDAERVLLQALRDQPNSVDLNEELAKTMIASGRLRDGVMMLEQLSANANLGPTRTARLHSAMGVAYDRAEQHAKAQAQYGRALRADPHNAMALNNLGLSYAMDGKLDLAEKTLRRALVAPTAGTQVRQNLAMVLSLQGDVVEAKRLVSQDLPPSMARQTVNYFGSIVDQRDVWRDAATQ